jgi:hypothetical protein
VALHAILTVQQVMETLILKKFAFFAITNVLLATISKPIVQHVKLAEDHNPILWNKTTLVFLHVLKDIMRTKQIINVINAT